MIATPDEIITFLQVPQSKFEIIDRTIPIVQDWLFNRLQNWFHTEDDIWDATIAFVHSDANADTITDSGNRFLDTDIDFSDDMDIHIEGSKRNDGTYRVDKAAAGTLTLNEVGVLVNESADNLIRITRMQFPVALKMPFASLVGFFIEKRNPILSSRSLGGRSESYLAEGDVPSGLMKQFGAWRNHSFRTLRA